MSLQTPSSCENVNVLMMDYPAYGLQESSLLMRLYFDVRLRSEHPTGLEFLNHVKKSQIDFT